MIKSAILACLTIKMELWPKMINMIIRGIRL